MTHVDIAATIAPEDKLSKTLLKDIKVNEESIDIIELHIDQWPSFNKALLNEVIKQLKIFHLKILVTY
ncbi:3-dehydroquinate dehydratase, partial [Staphylococcus epidermidis]